MKKKEKVIFKDSQEIKELSRGFVKNWLIPQGEVLVFNKRNSNLLNFKKNSLEKVKINKENEEINLYEKINNHSMFFKLKKNDETGEVFGSIGPKEIIEKLNEFGIEKNQLINFHPLNQLGESIVRIKLGANLIAETKVIIKAE